MQVFYRIVALAQRLVYLYGLALTTVRESFHD
jgi:hypothetical protein